MTYAEQLAAAERELAMRRRVYPRWIDAGKTTPAKAAHEIAAMEAICNTLRPIAEKERLI